MSDQFKPEPPLTPSQVDGMDSMAASLEPTPKELPAQSGADSLRRDADRGDLARIGHCGIPPDVANHLLDRVQPR